MYASRRIVLDEGRIRDLAIVNPSSRLSERSLDLSDSSRDRSKLLSDPESGLKCTQ